jgi:hypothetical protein
MEAVEFTCTRDDFLRAQRLAQTVRLRGRGFLTVLVLCVGVIGVMLVLMHGGDHAPIAYGLIAGAQFVALIALWMVFNRFLLLPVVSRRQFSQRKEFAEALRFEIRPSAIAVTSKNGVNAIPTTDFLKWTRNDHTLLLYRSDNMFNFVPLRATTDAFRAALLAELERAGVPKAHFSNS